MNSFNATKKSTFNLWASAHMGNSKGIFPRDETEIPADVTTIGIEKVIDIASLCASELALLKKNDPFMYYSIPGAREETLTHHEPDITDLNLQENSSRPLLNDDKDQSQPCLGRRSSNARLLVKRKSRISHETHFSLVMQDVMELHSPLKKKRRSFQCPPPENPPHSQSTS